MDYDGIQHQVITQRFGESGQFYVLSYGSGTFTEVDRVGTERRYSYDTTSKAITDVTVEMGANDHTTSYYWDDSTLVTKVIFPEGNGIRYVYDQGRLTTMARCTSSGLSRDDLPLGLELPGNELRLRFERRTGRWSRRDRSGGNTWTLGRDALATSPPTRPRNILDDEWALGLRQLQPVGAGHDPETGGRSTTTAAGAS